MDHTKPSLKEYGVVQTNLDPLIERVRGLPKEAWEYRSDKESYTTAALRPDSIYWKEVKDLIDEVLMTAEFYLKPGFQNRVCLSLVPAGERILPHTDDFGQAVRSKSIHCHIPLISHQDIKMGFGPDDTEEYHLEVGKFYSMDETIRHYVNNPSQVDRVHLLLAHWPHDGILPLDLS